MLKTGQLWKSLHLLISLALYAGLALSPAQPAYTATYTVNSLTDQNDGTAGGQPGDRWSDLQFPQPMLGG